MTDPEKPDPTEEYLSEKVRAELAGATRQPKEPVNGPWDPFWGEAYDGEGSL